MQKSDSQDICVSIQAEAAAKGAAKHAFRQKREPTITRREDILMNFHLLWRAGRRKSL
jgi:hypothetical protein